MMVKVIRAPSHGPEQILAKNSPCQSYDLGEDFNVSLLLAAGGGPWLFLWGEHLPAEQLERPGWSPGLCIHH